MDNGIKIQFLGGSNEVGSLAMVLELEGMRFLFEYGMSPSKPPTYPLPPPTVDLTLLTHAHLDHSGMIPWLCGRENQTVLATALTNKITNLLFKDSIYTKSSFSGCYIKLHTFGLLESNNVFYKIYENVQ